MIYELSRDIEEMLHARRYPVRVEYGPQRAQRKLHGSAILIERDRGASDLLGPPLGQLRNPRKVATRTLMARARLFVRSSLPGAHIGDHERECERLVDAFTVSLHEWHVQCRAGAMQITEARYLAENECDDIEAWPGVIYVIRFRVPRAVMRLDYTGEARPESALSGITTGEVRVFRDGSTDDPEIVPVEIGS